MKRSLAFLGILILVNFLFVWGQEVVYAWKWIHAIRSPLATDGRYYLGSLILLIPLAPWVLLRRHHGRKILIAGFAILAITALGYLVKARIPGSNRHAKIAACDWAAETIRAEYAGPSKDAQPHFSWFDYHMQNRPVVDAHTARVAYLLNGRQANLVAGGLLDIPEFIVGEPDRINRDWWCVADYQPFATRTFGSRTYTIYKMTGLKEKKAKER